MVWTAGNGHLPSGLGAAMERLLRPVQLGGSHTSRMQLNPGQQRRRAQLSPKPTQPTHVKPVGPDSVLKQAKPLQHEGPGALSKHAWPRSAQGNVVVVTVVVVTVLVVVVPQTFGVWAPQIAGGVQLPQFSVLRQLPLLTNPQLAPSASHVVVVQQMPFGRLPGGLLLTHTLPQQLTFVRHCSPSALQGVAAASRSGTQGPRMRAASRREHEKARREEICEFITRTPSGARTVPQAFELSSRNSRGRARPLQ